MCVIAVKCKGSDFAPKEAIAKCIEANPHGNAIVWNEDGQVRVFRSMSASETMAKYEELISRLDRNETAMLFHARRATHGSKKLENCHGFVHGNIAMCHNGVFSNIVNRDDMTDSETLFRDFFVPAYDNVSPEFAFKMVKAIIGNSWNKLAFLDNVGHVEFVSGGGDFHKVAFNGYHGKIYFSNLNWQPSNRYSMGFDPYADIRKPAAKTKTSATGVGSAQRKPANRPILAVSECRLENTVNGLIGELFKPACEPIGAGTQ